MSKNTKSKGIDVLQNILEWSSSPSRPDWQRDALRRLVTTGDLVESDFEELTALCKATHGLAKKCKLEPLEERHLPKRRTKIPSIKLISLTHHGGVNALAMEQSIQFGPALTIVYGANAAGKSGYTRILKRVCRARGAEEILGNVLVGSAPGRPSATIRFSVGDEERELAWNDQGETHDALGHVSVFDNKCAAVYLREKTDVAFRPFGLDLFDKLSDACEAVRTSLEKEERELARQRVGLPNLVEGTAAYELVSRITSLTDRKEVKNLGILNETQKKRLKDIRKRIYDLQAEDTKKAARILDLRAQRLETLSSILKELNDILENDAIKTLFERKTDYEKTRKAAKTLQASTFPPSLLKGTGSDLWRGLWEAARSFSTNKAYPKNRFPFTKDEARCVLCQQDLSSDAGGRLSRFEEFLQSTVQQELDQAKATYKDQLVRIKNVDVQEETTQEALEELKIEAEKLAKSIEDGLEQIRKRQEMVLKAIREDLPIPEELPDFELLPSKVTSEAQALRNRATQLLQNNNPKGIDALQEELQELEARETLSMNIKSVYEEIERKKKLAAYQLCLKDTLTQSITRKSTELTKRTVTQHLAKSFKDELKRIQFTHLEIELQAAGGSRGALFHKLLLKRAIGVDLPNVVSEGEARSLSIAAFFSELSTATDRSTILFDDPVSSLDHTWREHVARRLAEEAKVRQVIVFTHDIVFLHALVRWAKVGGVYCKHQHLQRESQRTGVSSPDFPWVALKVKDRIGVLKRKWQQAEKLHRTATREEYELMAIYIYKHLRDTWERGLEEILLGGVVERYRQSIQTQKARYLSDITDTDCKALESGMTKCSRCLHDQASAENVPVPEPEELWHDIEVLEEWVNTIRKRRE